MRKILLTGGAGFFGDILKRRLLEGGFAVVSVDLHEDPSTHPSLQTLRLDLRDRAAVDSVFAAHRFDAVIHAAAILAHDVKDEDFLWSSNVEGTRNLADAVTAAGVKKIVFISSNCLWAENPGRAVREDDAPNPVEIYGRSKWEAEKILLSRKADFDTIVLRSPTITDAGRLGLLTILFDFILEGRRVWVVGGGRNRYQFVYGPDLAEAAVLAIDKPGTHVFGIGSDDVKPLRDVYRYVIEKAGTGARVATLPRFPTLPLMRLATALGVSPLGPYHYRMIAEDFVFDTSAIKRELGWRPTLTNEEMLFRAFDYYRQNRNEIHARKDVSAHKRAVRLGVINLLKWIS